MSRRAVTGMAATSAAAAAALAARAVGPVSPAGAAPVPYFDVRDYGAVPNSASDQTAFIQAAINAASNAASTADWNAGGVVVLPPGTFRIAGTVDLKATGTGAGPGAVDMVGAGRWQSRLLCTTAGAGLRNGPLAGQGRSAGATGGFSVDGGGVAWTAFGIGECSNRTFFDIRVHNAPGVGVAVDRCQNALFEQLLVTQCGVGLQLDHGAGGNTFTAVQLRGSTTNLLLRATGSSSEIYGGRPTDNKFVGGIIEGGTGEATTLQIDHASGVENYFIGVRIGGNGYKVKVHSPTSWAPSNDLYLIGCFLVSGNGIEHLATNSTIHLTATKFQSLSPAFRLGPGCNVDLDKYQGSAVTTRFQAVSGAVENDLVRRRMVHALAWASGETNPDVALRRTAAGRLQVDGQLVATAGLGVGNSATATTLGSVVRRIQVFDANGTALGFVPVYNTIS